MDCFFVEQQLFSGQIIKDSDGNIWKVHSCVDYNWFRNKNESPNKFILTCQLICKDVKLKQ